MNLIWKIIIAIIILLFWLYGLERLLASVAELRKAIQSKRWFSIQALVTHHEVTSHTTSGRAERTYYFYAITYTYTIDGIEYFSKGFESRGFNDARAAEAEALERYPVGRIVDVFYNPKQHGESVSLKGLNADRLASFLFSFLFSFGLLGLMTSFLVHTVLSMFGISNTVAGNLSQPFLWGVIAFPLFFCSVGLITLWVVVTEQMGREPLASTLSQFAVGCFMFAIGMYWIVQMISDPLGLLVIGPKPGAGCYRPDFRQRAWLPTDCPQHVDL